LTGQDKKGGGRQDFGLRHEGVPNDILSLFVDHSLL
jgi:hypothetical protein